MIGDARSHQTVAARYLSTGGLVVTDAAGEKQGRGAPTFLRDPSAERIAVVSLSSDTVAQTVWMLHKHRVQIASWLPWHLRAEVAAHHAATHLHECTGATCAQARQWIAQAGARQTRYA